jgi:hypothetical protein
MDDASPLVAIRACRRPDLAAPAGQDDVARRLPATALAVLSQGAIAGCRACAWTGGADMRG